MSLDTPKPAIRSLFQPDLFSDSTPRFSPLALEHRVRLASILLRHYGLEARPESFEQSGGQEVNSSNFRCTAGEKVLLLKRLRGEHASSTARKLEVIAWLKGKAEVPAVLRGPDGAPVTAEGDEAWCLFQFAEGNFFSGAREELVPTAKSIANLHVVLRELPPTLGLPAEWEYMTEAEERLFHQVAEHQMEWPVWFGVNEARLLLDNWSSICEIRETLRLHRQVIRGARTQVCHADLHPHNVLVRSNGVEAFLDCQSFQAVPPETAVGFAIYKLLRQFLAREWRSRSSVRDIRRPLRQFASVIFRGLGTQADHVHWFGIFGLAEVWRRLFVILRLNVHDRNQQWNHVLPVQLAGLRELPFVFEQIE